jgi:hypothetical protein
MPRECYPSRAFCTIHNHGGIQGLNLNNSRIQVGSAAGNFTNVRIATKAGEIVQLVGKEEIARAPFAIHPLSEREWTQYTKKEHKVLRRTSATNPMSVKKVSSKKIDYRPAKSSRKQARHFQRQPRRGATKSVIPKGKTRNYRLMRLARGSLLVGTGKAIPIIGYALYGYELYKSDDPGMKILLDSREYLMEFYRLRPAQRAYFEETTSSVFSDYLSRWARSLN